MHWILLKIGLIDVGNMAKKKLRPLGFVTQDLEPLLLEMGIDHDLQHGEIMNLIYGYLLIHLPEQKEEYLDGTSPVFYFPMLQKK